ncbi:DNA-binding transcriptional regulator, MocR family, contains an aminotransferase domain [Carnobacterium iners]|uniref:DNA-binding transcriptional regulator, MocR family, contains an aminotransferase domain n=1 Tax=Carnobacterium iners TaxID=1073423 RepID=A0A1X7NKW8_9LACT|nr:aminotransferase class I/II-fold pyridoxal phosphate-dependent enzyme [Carnobacterium iners]SEK67219.1 DNA-binding transcriptional regulator, MocR family, contains an aminotransferase domain [Carnobacterium iners]SMH37810.1 DNA-binding transcriptional regulator, MocR family, contains an aminotransferase domain [Carnobacterium iners]
MGLNNDKATRHLSSLEKEYENYLEYPLNLNITRGIPSEEQLQLSQEMLGMLNDPEDFLSKNKMDIRNYGELTGIIEAKELFSAILGSESRETIIGGNSSLSLMYFVLTTKLFMGSVPWKTKSPIKFLCPSPGYDRHFSMTEKLGIEMIPIEMDENGPNMDQVERLVLQDQTIKGIWCVPNYSNPTGIIYSDEVVNRLAKMKTSATDFIIMWDNAYAVHHLTQENKVAKNILTACKEAGNSERPWMFCSTSKITFPGAGVSAVAASEKNITMLANELSYQTIGHDKLNQMRHVKFLKNTNQLKKHMEKHALILKPKFDLIQKKLNERFNESNLLTWTNPKGGYFVHLTTMDGCATEIVESLDRIGVKVTKAGATYPSGNNPRDNSIRLAPTSVELADLEQAMDVIGLCIEMISLREGNKK